jgi:flagellin
MTFRVNHNTKALNAHRNLLMNQTDLSRSLERLSSGVQINRASDGPAKFAISEHLRSQVAGLSQAIDNSEVAVSMLQTTEANMAEISTLLTNVRQLVIHAMNEGANDEAALLADQKEIETTLETIEMIAGQAQFGNKKLLDGSNGVSGTTTGDDLEFIGATMNSKDSREHGYDVKIMELATRANVKGTAALTSELIKAGEQLTVIENGKNATYVTRADDTIDTAVQNFRSQIDKAGLDVEVALADDGTIEVNHRKYGSNPSFQVLSSSAGVLSENAGRMTRANTGNDIKGTINGESATGNGQILTGIAGAKCTDGLSVRFYGEGKDYLLPPFCEVADLESGEEEGEARPEVPAEGLSVGRVFITQNSMKFQVGGNKAHTIGISLFDMKPDNLGTNVPNLSSFESLADIDVSNFQRASDSLMMVDKAVGDIAAERGKLGAFQKNSLETNLSNLRVANENLISSESLIRDTDMAKEMAVFTRDQIKTQSSTAMLAQANQVSANVLKLLA